MDGGCFSDSNLSLSLRSILGGTGPSYTVDYVVTDHVHNTGAFATDAPDARLVLLTGQTDETGGSGKNGIYCVVKPGQPVEWSAVNGGIAPGALVVALKSRAVFVATPPVSDGSGCGYKSVSCAVGSRMSCDGVVERSVVTVAASTDDTGNVESEIRLDAEMCTVKRLATHSDLTLKTDVRVVEGATQVLEKIRGYTFDWLDGSTARERLHTPDYREYGLIAQEVQRAVPSAVVQSGGTLSVSYASIVPLLVEAVRALSARVAQLEARAS
jgi:hypothetical protein